jgi:flagellar protein FlbD
VEDPPWNGTAARFFSPGSGRIGIPRGMWRYFFETGNRKRRENMIPVTRLNGSELFINPDLILTIEVTPNTVITFTSDEKIIVQESPEVIVNNIVEFQARVHNFEVSSEPED